tara:strand:+ start:11947 stop:13251 length:1305 start_codon:yes stop_codon:yes gene_type:complete
MKKLLTIIISVLFSSNQIPGPTQSNPILLRNGIIHTISDGTIYGPDLLFDNGKIIAIGYGLDIPANTEIIDVSEKHIYPGLISAGSTLGLQEINSVRATRDYAETGSINPNVNANVSYHPDSELIPVSRSNGILLSHVIPQSGRIPGISSMMLLDGWTWEDCTLKHPIAMNLNWPSMDLNFSHWNKKSIKEQEKTRENALNEIDKIFNSARAYNKLDKFSFNFKSNPRLQALLKVINGEIPLIIKANSVKEIESSIYWAENQDIEIIILGGKDAWRVTDLLVEKDIPIIFESVLSTPKRRYEDYDQPYKTPKVLFEAGVKFCISNSTSSFQTPHLRNLPYHAAMAASFGLLSDEAIRSITLSTAEILGIADLVGSLEPGKDATLFISDGDILDIRSNVEIAYINGKRVDMSDRHKMLYRKYTEKYIQKSILPKK